MKDEYKQTADSVRMKYVYCPYCGSGATYNSVENKRCSVHHLDTIFCPDCRKRWKISECTGAEVSGYEIFKIVQKQAQ